MKVAIVSAVLSAVIGAAYFYGCYKGAQQERARWTEVEF